MIKRVFETQWSFEHKKPRVLSKEPSPLKDDLPFKSLTERALEAQAMGEAYIQRLRNRFMIPVDKIDLLDKVENMDDILTEFDYCEDIGDSQRAYKNYMVKKAVYEKQLRMAREAEAFKSTPLDKEPEPAPASS